MLLGLGNPLLDISAVADASFLQKYGLDEDNAILAEEKHMPIYEELVKLPDVEYLAGGATQNSMRIAQWILGKDNMTTFFGCVGKDDYSHILQEKASEAGVRVKYQYHDTEPTGTCAVVITNHGKCRSLVANLAAANHFTKCHLEIPENRSLIEKAKIFYISGFFLTVSPDSILTIGEHAMIHNKTFCMNLSAPFLCEYFKEPMMKALPYVDILFGNEDEAAKFNEVHGFGLTNVKDLALKIATLPKMNTKRSRVVIITQGAESVIAVVDGVAREYPVTRLSDDEIIDTNGAGDAFVGGYLAELANGLGVDECVKCAIWAATQIIKQSGCTFPVGVSYTR